MCPFMQTFIPDWLFTALHIHQFIFAPASYHKETSPQLVATELSWV